MLKNTVSFFPLMHFQCFGRFTSSTFRTGIQTSHSEPLTPSLSFWVVNLENRHLVTETLSWMSNSGLRDQWEKCAEWATSLSYRLLRDKTTGKNEPVNFTRMHFDFIASIGIVIFVVITLLVECFIE